MTDGLLRYPASAPLAWTREADVVIVGTGAAGLSAALSATAQGRRVTLLTKGSLSSGATPWAQGGLAAVMDSGDSRESHLSDTVAAGVGLVDEEAARDLVWAAPGAIRTLIKLGARFDRGHLGLEGGHSHRRVVHAGGDATGGEVHRVLREAVLNARIEVLEDTMAIDAVTHDARGVVGLVAARVRRDQGNVLDPGVIFANAVVLASGGFGQAYGTTTNPLEATGDGLALAARAGAELCDLEFVQFHPTVLYQPGRHGQRPLVSEALRGAGAVLIDGHGRRVMEGQHPLGDLAPRDVVAITMQRRMSANDASSTHLWLDARMLGKSRLEKEFPTVTSACRSCGVDPAVTPIPVAPGAHYACGGVLTDREGRTTLEGLYAVGELAFTGAHGANRLASNSITEALVSGRHLGQFLGSARGACQDVGSTRDVRMPAVGLGVDPAQREALAQETSRHAGVLRCGQGLDQLLEQLSTASDAEPGAYDLDTLEATNLHTVTALVASAAVLREESRGSHQRSDFTEERATWLRRIRLRVLEDSIVADVGVLT